MSLLPNKGFLGINARNLLFIRPYNPKKAIELAKDKLATKEKLIKKGIPVPKLYHVFTEKSDLENYNWKLLPNSFVIKPRFGFGGKGILVIYGKKKNTWVKPDYEEISLEEIKLHILDILEGTYSLGNIPDSAIIEQKIKIHPRFKKYVFRGVPDIRIIVFKMVPIMAMLRLPTEESEGRANLHGGAIGVGIEIGSGITTHGYLKGEIINQMPETKLKLNGIRIPFWNEILFLAVKVQEITRLGYLGVDIVIDKYQGPVVLEVNAYPGLEIQNVNLLPLRSRLELVKPLKIKEIAKGVRIGKELFSEDIALDIEDISGKKVIGRLELVKIIKGKKKYPVVAKIDTGAWRTTVCRSLKEKLGLSEVVGQKIVKSVFGKERREIVEVTFSIRGKRRTTHAFVADRKEMKYDMIIGRRDLADYLIDPTKIDPKIVQRQIKKETKI